MSAKHVSIVATLALAAGCTAEQPSKGDGTQEGTAEISANAITCTYPVRPGDTAQTILERLDKDARREELMGGEGEMFDGVVLWPDDPGRRLELSFAKDGIGEVTSLRVAGERPDWNIAGVGHGTTRAELERLNGGPFEFYGFGWDYGGQVSDWNGGALGDIEGGCSLGAMIGGMEDEAEMLPTELVGDRSVRSDTPSLRALDVKVFDLWINYP
ncbi:hypothetical protein [Porphyrobacter sp. ULC335]|uniref:hypothetical protein n=1 Tax=Porphyrobacter sp. ULC335 TaxID=2854260 RepID=UPI00221F8A6F|nr:hypothetical protein [Porphyrobacter sp. ULC335]UYV15173.1 hypothetical protein KVF90_13730 [Porphyrobacter sp. ULC335]